MEVKLSDQPALNDFLNNQAVAVIALPIDNEGTLHIATLHYWHETSPLTFYFVTSKDSEKCRLLMNGDSVHAACVVDTNTGTPFTLQMRGEARIVPKDEFRFAIDGYTKKRGNSHDVENEGSVLIEFRPTWARYTDYSKGYDHSFLDLS